MSKTKKNRKFNYWGLCMSPLLHSLLWIMTVRYYGQNTICSYANISIYDHCLTPKVREADQNRFKEFCYSHLPYTQPGPWRPLLQLFSGHWPVSDTHSRLLAQPHSRHSLFILKWFLGQEGITVVADESKNKCDMVFNMGTWFANGVWFSPKHLNIYVYGWLWPFLASSLHELAWHRIIIFPSLKWINSHYMLCMYSGYILLSC